MRQEIRRLYNEGKLAYSQGEDVFYDPSSDTFLDQNGDIVEVYLPENWQQIFDFKFSNGLKLSNTSTSNELTWTTPPRRSEDKFKPTNIVNFLVPGLMSLCSKTDNSTPHPTAHWKDQRKCTFAQISITGPRCMFWNGDLDGHCDSADAYAHLQGKEIDFNRINKLRSKDGEKDLYKNFEKAKKVLIGTLNSWYEEGKLEMVHNVGIAGKNLFYCKHLDVYFDGHGNFLESFTIDYRKSEKDYKQFVDEKLKS